MGRGRIPRVAAALTSRLLSIAIGQQLDEDRAETVRPKHARLPANQNKRDVMAHDAARAWISPHFIGAGMWTTGRVWVLNPNTTKADVTVIFYDSSGGKGEEKGGTLSPGQIFEFWPNKTGGHMWVRVLSDQPVLPWGACEASIHITEYVQMAFYRAEGLGSQEALHVPIEGVKAVIQWPLVETKRAEPTTTKRRSPPPFRYSPQPAETDDVCSRHRNLASFRWRQSTHALILRGPRSRTRPDDARPSSRRSRVSRRACVRPSCRCSGTDRDGN